MHRVDRMDRVRRMHGMERMRGMDRVRWVHGVRRMCRVRAPRPMRADARLRRRGPRLLVADEPTAHLDRFSGRMVIRLLERAVEEGTTVVAASHDPDLVAAAQTTLTLPAGIAASAS